MKVTKQMLHEDLQPGSGLLAFLPSVFRFKWVIRFLNWLSNLAKTPKQIEGLDCEERHIESSDGSHQIRLAIYRPQNVSGDLPCMLYIHGGGYIMGNPEQALELIGKFIRTRPCVVIAPHYRKAFTRPFPAGFDDCYQTLLWAKENAGELGIFPDRFVVAGHSAGGGLTAAVTLKARDTRDVDIAFQMPIYPMIDDTQPTDAARYIQAPVWDTRMNELGWGSYLADLHASGAEIPAYAAPARNSDYRDFPPTITFVGTLEPFYWETGSYVEALRAANIDTIYEEFEGCYHGFDLISTKAAVSKRAVAFTFDSFGTFYDKYVKREAVG